MTRYLMITVLAIFCMSPTETTCEAVLKKSGGVWTLHGCLGGCDDGDPCLETSLNSSAGNTWTSCLCNQNWHEQICSAVLKETSSGPPTVHCLRGGCADCEEWYYLMPEGEERMECYCQ